MITGSSCGSTKIRTQKLQWRWSMIQTKFIHTSLFIQVSTSCSRRSPPERQYPRLYVLVRHDLFLHPRSLGIQSSRIRRIQTRIPLVTHRRRELHRARWHHCLPISRAQRISHSAYRGPCHTRYRIMPRSLLSSRFLISPTDRENQLWKCIHVLVGYSFRTQHCERRTRWLIK